ncbi:MAG: hypothetical protein Q9160_002941 [Pyrenula sp. 1 TL-2023]
MRHDDVTEATREDEEDPGTRTAKASATGEPSNPFAKLFEYTSGRFLYNDQVRLAERHVQFNVRALKQRVEKWIDHGRVSTLHVLAEGGFNRIFRLTMEDGYKLIVKILYESTVPAHYTATNEVATATFLRSKDFAVPKVDDWSSKASKHNVGVEYIIIEQAAGIGLDIIWFGITKEQSREIVSS